MDEQEELQLPPDIEWRLEKIYVKDIDNRLRELTYLVALQETELALMWITLIGLATYVLVKEHRGQRTDKGA